MSLEDKGAAESRRKRIDCDLGAVKAELRTTSDWR